MSRRGEWVTAAGWAAFGALVLAASWRMDRLEHQGVAAWSAPGLTPGVVGALIIVFAIGLALKARGEPDGDRDSPAVGAPAAEAETAVPDTDAPAGGPGPTPRTVIALALCVGFAGLSLGRGLPFAVEAAVFVFAFIALLRWHEWPAGRPRLRGLAQTLVIALASSAAIAWLFESVFLVRLP